MSESEAIPGTSVHKDSFDENDDFEVFNNDYRNFLNNQIKKLIESKQDDKVLDKMDELDIAIDLCKKLLIEIGDKDKRKAAIVMDMMVELRIEFTQLKENINNGLPADSIAKISGHELVLQTTTGTNPYCDICVGTIWRLAQYWRRCTLCGLRTHDKCLSSIKLPCVASIVSQEGFQFETKICPETSLPRQNYECYQCQASIAYDESSALEPRLCDYTGNYYCKKCHWNDLMVIPARVFHNWDFTPKLVCRRSKRLLTHAMKKPIINIQKINSVLPQYIAILGELCQLRKDIIYMKCYLTSCKSARKMRILQHLNRHQHFVDGYELFSFEDLIKLMNDSLLTDIKSIVNIFKNHITEECIRCTGHAYICELCSTNERLYLFSKDVSICNSCYGIFHEKCFTRISKRCPRCSRRESRRMSQINDI